MASLDGQNAPPIHHNSILPLMMQSPLLPKICILEAAGFQEIFRRPDVAEMRSMIHLKGEILAQINSFLREDFNKTHQEAIQSVIHLIILEVEKPRGIYKAMLICGSTTGVILQALWRT